MSVIVRNENYEIFLFTKGADISMIDRLIFEDEEEKEELNSIFVLIEFI